MSERSTTRSRPARALSVRVLGAAGTVTGSKFLVQAGRTRVLVDCGLYQGLKQLRLRNWKKLPLDLSRLDAVVLTHAHIDHSGLLPRLYREGYRGPTYATAATADLCGILLPDSGHLHEEDAAYANRKGFSKHHPALPLYTEEEGRRAHAQIRAVGEDGRLDLGDLTLRFRRAGHILGAASVEIEGGGRRLAISGDLGRDDDPICPAPEPAPAAGTVLMESTYGDRCHGDVRPADVLARIASQAAESGGTVLIPAFAVGRVQALLYWLELVFAEGRAPRLPVIVDSPMATSVTELYRRHHASHRLTPQECARVFDGVRFVRSVEESRSLADRQGPCVLVSASGMLTGGRVLHHFKRLAPDPRSVILLAGFQAPGTRGAALLAGKTEIKMHGGYVPVRARVESMDTLSAHADREGLLAWLGAAATKPRRVVLVHGEAEAADSLRQAIEERFAIPTSVAELDQRIVVSA